VRLIIPEMYGYKNVKWLNGINLVGRPQDGYWENLGYDRDAWVGHSNGYGT
jgi:DMSO/TMAO reductase YedYZ molybdopterin-dependent catalytic subunit